jgi:2-polyprenyl-3-methyl-5-hydroxy-6-metoxy-1,4-benzoquinol methylase
MDSSRARPAATEATPSSTASPAKSKPTGYHGHARLEMVDYVPPGVRRVADVGCGEGLFGAALRARGAEVWGIEIDEAAAATARTRLDRVLVGDVAAAMAELPAGAFDCIVFNDVLEHLIDPRAILRAAKTRLAPGGVIVCSIPNVRHYRNLWNLIVHKQWRYEDAGTLDRTHLRFFTERSIADMFDELGFETLRLEGINGFTSWKFALLGKLSLGLLSDVFHIQFACVVRPIDPTSPQL